jgi:hypothetical protein
MKRRKEDKRPQLVNEAIKRVCARLAEKHYRRAIASINCNEAEPGHESGKRLIVIEQLLEKAGNNATRWYFCGNTMD